MAPYSEEQLKAYFHRIKLSSNAIIGNTLDDLSLLQKHQLSHIPFESLSLHYSEDRRISLDLNDLYEKIVIRKRGGYCLENNTFFAAILRSLGFQVMHIGCRVTNANRGIRDGSWRPMTHMANIVTVGERRYLADVGFGAEGPCCPMPLIDNLPMDGLSGQQLKLEYRNLPQHSDAEQRVWVYSYRQSPGVWNDMYHFADIEFLHDDFIVFNYYNMSLSPFAKTVIVLRFFFDEINSGRPVSGVLQLIRGQIERKLESNVEPVATLATEPERLEAFSRYFDIQLSEAEAVAIRGRQSELI